MSQTSAAIFRHQHRVVYAECTVGNHVYYSRYLEILEGARGEFFRHAGLPLAQLQAGGVIFPVAGLELSYQAPARYDELLLVELWLTQLAGARLNFGFRIVSATGALLVEGVTRHVCAGLDEKPKRLPEEVIQPLRPFLQPVEPETAVARK